MKMAGSGGGSYQRRNTPAALTAARAAASSKSYLPRRGCKLLVLLLSVIITLCLYGLWNSQSDLPTRKSRHVDETFVGTPKIAFLFLTRRNLPLDIIWASFFQGVDMASYSIYIHSRPRFMFYEKTTKSPLFYGRQLKNSIQVEWGESSMIKAERLLLDAALEDPANQRFVLLSDSCIPLYNFTYVYNYVMGSPKSFVDCFLDKKEGRYNPLMSHVISKDNWRKGSQWFTLIRRHAEAVVDDQLVFPVFKRFCKKLQKQHNCIPDEHYLQTLLTMLGFEKELERRTLTYTEWNEPTSNIEGEGWHPVTFSNSAATPQRIQGIKDINHVYYETEYRNEWCQTNSTAVPCFLFARKFTRVAAMRLLSEGLF